MKNNNNKKYKTEMNERTNDGTRNETNMSDTTNATPENCKFLSCNIVS